MFRQAGRGGNAKGVWAGVVVLWEQRKHKEMGGRQEWWLGQVFTCVGGGVEVVGVEHTHTHTNMRTRMGGVCVCVCALFHSRSIWCSKLPKKTRKQFCHFFGQNFDWCKDPHPHPRSRNT